MHQEIIDGKAFDIEHNFPIEDGDFVTIDLTYDISGIELPNEYEVYEDDVYRAYFDSLSGKWSLKSVEQNVPDEIIQFATQQFNNGHIAFNKRLSKAETPVSVDNPFLKVVIESDLYAYQPWVDKNIWSISKNRVLLCVRVGNNSAKVWMDGYGSCPELIAITPEELRECINCWWRNR